MGGRQARYPRPQDALDHCCRRIESGIEKNRAQNGLQGIRQNRRPAEAAGFQFALPQPQMFPQTQLLSNLRQGLAIDESRPQPRQ
jgi:hypothetical protein